MRWLYEVPAYINVLLTVGALVVAASWPREQRGKALMCAFLATALATVVVFQLVNLLCMTNVMPWEARAAHALRTLGILGNLASHVILVAFVLAVASFARAPRVAPPRPPPGGPPPVVR